MIHRVKIRPKSPKKNGTNSIKSDYRERQPRQGQQQQHSQENRADSHFVALEMIGLGIMIRELVLNHYRDAANITWTRTIFSSTLISEIVSRLRIGSVSCADRKVSHTHSRIQYYQRQSRNIRIPNKFGGAITYWYKFIKYYIYIPVYQLDSNSNV